MNIGLHIFRRDLRIYDNLALNELYKQVDKILCIFILDNNQIDLNDRNKYYFSNNAVQFICESLEDLNDQLDNKLMLFKGEPIDIINKIIKQENITHISFNNDYTIYSNKRDDAIIKLCKNNNIEVITEDDQFLVEPGSLCKSDETPYMVFGSFYKNHSKYQIIKTVNIKKDKYYKININIKQSFNISKLKELYDFNEKLTQIGGRVEAFKKLTPQNIRNFKKRDELYIKSFNISAYLNMGCISVREMFNYVKYHEEITKQLIWRDFYNCIMIYNPDGNKYMCLDHKYDNVKWPTVNKTEWNKFVNCNTGFLLIDAAFKELQTTGYIGNRQRLLLGTFWIKYLLIDPFNPRYGIQVGFSKYLVDCVFSQNVMNIRWLMSELDLPGRRFIKKGSKAITGRMIKISNDMIKKYDPECIYIRKWLNLKDYTNKELYNYETIFDADDRYKQYCRLF